MRITLSHLPISGLIYGQITITDYTVMSVILICVGTEDPIGAGLNWYTYCSGNPLAFIDPFGLFDVNIDEYAQRMGATTELYTNSDGKQCIRVTYNGISQGYTYYNSGNIDYTVLDKRFGWTHDTIVFYYTPDFTTQAFNSPYYNSSAGNVLMIPVLTATDFVTEWNKLDDSNIKNMYLYIHSGDGRNEPDGLGNLCFKDSEICFSNKKNTYSSSVDWLFQDLNNKRVSDYVYFFGCRGGGIGKNGTNVAWTLAEKTGASVIATTGATGAWKKVNGVYYPTISWKCPFDTWERYYYSNGKASKDSKIPRISAPLPIVVC